MTKADSFKLPTKRETIVLKVFIHCDQCQKQVKKVLKKLDGIESVVIDAELGKVSVVGTVPMSALVKKLGKAGKYAAPWGSIPASFASSVSPSSTNKDPKNDQFLNITNPNKVSIKQLPDYDSFGVPKMGSTLENLPRISTNMHEQNKYIQYMLGSDLNELSNNMSSVNGHKKFKGGKRVSFGAGSGVGVGEPLILSHQVHSNDHIMNTSNAMISTKTLSVLDHRNMESVEFATSMFSDENANSCSIM